MSPTARSPRRAARPRLPVLVLVAFALAACSGGGGDAVATLLPADPLEEEARTEGRVGVIVQLAVDQERPGIWNLREVAREQRKLLDHLGRGATVVTRYRKFPQIALLVTPPALRKLRAYPKIANISLSSTDEPTE